MEIKNMAKSFSNAISVDCVKGNLVENPSEIKVSSGGKQYIRVTMAANGVTKEDPGNPKPWFPTLVFFDECISFMEQSTLKHEQPQTVIEQTSIFKSKVIEVEDYKDLGTWEEIGTLLSQNQST